MIPFSFAPPPLAGLGDERVRFAIDVDEYEPLDKRRVLVVGGGQAALESAGLAARAGAEVELVNRSAVRWFPDASPTARAGRCGRGSTGSPIRQSVTGRRC